MKPTGLEDVEEDGEPEAVAAVLNDEGCWDEAEVAALTTALENKATRVSVYEELTVGATGV